MNATAEKIEALSPLTKPQHLTSLASSGILVGVEMSIWTGTKQDRSVAAEITAAKHADPEAAKVIKNLLAKSLTHKAVCNHRQTVKNWLRRYTYPWAVSLDYLPTVRIPRFMPEYKVLEDQFKQVLLPAFFNEYPTIVANAAFTQGSMFNRDDYPSVEQLKSKFTMQLYTCEVPEADFRNQISSDLADDLFNHYTRQTEGILQSMHAEQCEQLAEVLESLSYCCETELVTGDDGEKKVKRRKIYESTISKALERCETFRNFNLANDPALSTAADRLQHLLNDIPLSVLKDSDSARQQMKTEVDDILKFFKPGPVA